MGVFYLKKWYFDLFSERDDVLYIYFITARIAGIGQGMVSAHLLLRDGNEVRASAKTQFALPDEAGKLKMSGHSFLAQQGFSRVQMKFHNLVLDLCYKSLGGQWSPAEDGILWKKNKEYLRWIVPQPSARVDGRISLGSQIIEVCGLGYQDIVETNISPWQLPISELLWGRSHSENFTVVFNQITTRRGDAVQNLLLRQDDSSFSKKAKGQNSEQPGVPNLLKNQRFSLRTDESDRTTMIIHPEFTLALTRKGVLEESPIVTRDRIKSGPLRNFLNRTCGAPEERKMVSSSFLNLGRETRQGHSIHERVVWHWGKR